MRQQLLAREWAVEEAGGLRLVKPGAVLDAWAAADDWGKRTSTREYSLLASPDPRQAAERLRAALPADQIAFTQGLAGWLRHPHTTPAIVTAYVREFPGEEVMKEKLLARPVSSGERLRLVRPGEDGVFNLLQWVDGLPLVCDPQIYLDLLQAGLRGEEQAKELRSWPDFAGGWT